MFTLFQKIFNRDEFEKLGGADRSPQWPRFRKEQIEIRGGKCELCGGKDKLELHHVERFTDNPSRELDSKNVLILCESGNNGIICHRSFGHLGSYLSINKDAVKDVAEWRIKILKRP